MDELAHAYPSDPGDETTERDPVMVSVTVMCDTSDPTSVQMQAQLTNLEHVPAGAQARCVMLMQAVLGNAAGHLLGVSVMDTQQH